MKHRARRMADPALMGDKAGHNTARTVRITVSVHRQLRPGVAGTLTAKILVNPITIEEFEEWEVEDVGPHDRGRAVIAVIMPSAVGREDQIPACRLASFAFDRRIAA